MCLLPPKMFLIRSNCFPIATLLLLGALTSNKRAVEKGCEWANEIHQSPQAPFGPVRCRTVSRYSFFYLLHSLLSSFSMTSESIIHASLATFCHFYPSSRIFFRFRGIQFCLLKCVCDSLCAFSPLGYAMSNWDVGRLEQEPFTRMRIGQSVLKPAGCFEL